MGASDGRFAPSPTGELHLGNLRTALLAWLFARRASARFIVRMEDLDRATSSLAHEQAQLRDLRLIGLDWDGPVVRQSDRFALYRDAIATLDARGLVYRCYCTRREIREAASAPNDVTIGTYPGTCRQLSATQRASHERQGRPPALRVRTDGESVSFVDRLHGQCQRGVDDVVLCRNDGVPAYNLAVVVDDDAQGVGEVVRGSDLLESTSRQVHLIGLLGLRLPSYMHVPLVVATDGTRLAKRHGAVTLERLAQLGRTVNDVRTMLATSIGFDATDAGGSPQQLVSGFDELALPRAAWVYSA